MHGSPSGEGTLYRSVPRSRDSIFHDRHTCRTHICSLHGTCASRRAPNGLNRRGNVRCMANWLATHAQQMTGPAKAQEGSFRARATEQCRTCRRESSRREQQPATAIARPEVN